MWKLLVLLLVGAASISHAWKPHNQYTYNVLARSLTALNEVSDQHVGILINAKLELQVTNPNILDGRIIKPMYAEVNQALHSGWEENFPTNTLSWQKLPLKNHPFQIMLKNGLFSELKVNPLLDEWEINMIKAILSPLQLNVFGSNAVKDKNNILPKPNSRSAVFKAVESTVTGQCEVLYDISPLPIFTAQEQPQLAPLADVTKVKLTEIIKTQNFKHCTKRAGVNFLSGITNFDPGQNTLGTLLSLSSVSRTIINGSLSDFTIQSSVTTNKMFLSPQLHNTQKGVSASRVNLTVISITPFSSSSAMHDKSSTLLSAGDLVYRNNPQDSEDQEISSEFSSRTSSENSYLGGKRISRSLSNNTSSSSSSSESNSPSKFIHKNIAMHFINERINKSLERDINFRNSFLRNPRSPKLLNIQRGSTFRKMNNRISLQRSGSSIRNQDNKQPPKTPLVPLSLANIEQGIDASVNAVMFAKDMATLITSEIKDASLMLESDTLSKFKVLIELARVMDVSQLRELTNMVRQQQENNEGNADDEFIPDLQQNVLRDAIAQAGTHPALLNILESINNQEVQNEEAAHIVSILPRSALLPTADYIDDFFNMAVNPNIKNQPRLNTTAPLAFAELLQRTIVDQNSARALGIKMKSTLFEKYIAHFGNELEEAFNEKDNPKIQVYIRILGNIGHPSILPHFQPYLEGAKSATKFQRLLMVTSLDKMASLYPKIVQPILFRLYFNTAESHEVRCAAVILLMKTKPPVILLQRMAEFTNVDLNRHVIATVQSSIRNAAALKGPSNTEFARRAQAAVSMLNPKTMDITCNNLLQNMLMKDSKLEQALNFIGSTDNIMPSAVFANIAEIFGNERKELLNFASITSSVKELLLLLEDQVDSHLQSKQSRFKRFATRKRPSPTHHRNPSEEDASFSADEATVNKDNLWEKLRMKQDTAEPLEANILFELLGQARVLAIDNQTIKRWIRELLKWTERPMPTINEERPRLLDLQNVIAAFPNALGLPTLFEIATPTLFDLKHKASFHFQPRNLRSSAGKFVFPEFINMTADVHARLIAQRNTKIGFVAPFNNMRYISGVQSKIMFNFPINMLVNLDLKNRHVSATLQPLQSNDFPIFQWSDVPYISQQNINALLPDLRSNATILHAHSPTRAKLDVGQETTGICFTVTALSEDKLLNLNRRASDFQLQDLYKLAETLLKGNSFHYKDLTIAFHAKHSTTKHVKLSFAIANLYEQSSEMDGNEESSSFSKYKKKSKNLHPRSLESYSFEDASREVEQKRNFAQPNDESPDSALRRQELLAKSAQLVGDATASVVDVSAVFVGKKGKPDATFITTIALARSMERPNTAILVYLRADPTVPSKQWLIQRGCLSANFKVPQLQLWNFNKALDSNPSANLDAQLYFGQTCSNGVLVRLKGRLDRSESRKAQVAEFPLAKECKKQMAENNNLLPACRTVLWQAIVPDHAHAVLNINDKKNVLPWESIPEEVNFDLQINENANAFELSFETPKKNIQYSVNIPRNLGDVLLLNNPTPATESMFNQLTSLISNPTCVIDHQTVKTFDGKTYPLQLEGACRHVVMIHTPKIRKQLQSNIFNESNVSIDISEAKEGRVVRLQVLDNIITLTPAGYSVRVLVHENGIRREISPDHVTMFYRKENRDPYAFVQAEPNNAVLVSIFLNNLRIFYDGYRVVVSTNGYYRDEVRGLCGTMDGDPVNDFKTPENCIVNDPRKFVKTYIASETECPQQFKEAQILRKKMPCIKQSFVPVEVVEMSSSKNAHSRGFNVQPADESSSSSSSSSSFSKSHQQSSSPFKSRPSSSSSSFSSSRLQTSKESSETFSDTSNSDFESRESKNVLSTRYVTSTASPHWSCTIHRTTVVEEGDEICFSIRPLPECTSRCNADKKIEKKFKFHCLPQGPIALHWKNMVKKGVNPDLSKKTVHKELDLSIPLKCKLN